MFCNDVHHHRQSTWVSVNQCIILWITFKRAQIKTNQNTCNRTARTAMVSQSLRSHSYGTKTVQTAQFYAVNIVNWHAAAKNVATSEISHLSGSSNLTVAAEWKTIDTSDDKRSMSEWHSPSPGSRMSPVTGTTFDWKWEFCERSESNSCNIVTHS